MPLGLRACVIATQMETRTAALLCVLLAIPLASCDTCDTQDFDTRFAGCKSLQDLTTQVASFLKKYNIPSLSLAYGSNGKLGFARTVGAANAEDGTKTCTTRCAVGGGGH